MRNFLGMSRDRRDLTQNKYDQNIGRDCINLFLETHDLIIVFETGGTNIEFFQINHYYSLSVVLE